MGKKSLAVDQELLDKAVSLFRGCPPYQQLSRGYENLVYQYMRNGKEYVLRLVYLQRRTRNQILAELEWIDYLADNGLRTPDPLKSVNGELVESVGSDDHSFWVTSFEKVNGRHLRTDEWSPPLFEDWGRLMGRMHRLTKEFKPSASEIKRPDWDDDPVLNLEMLRKDYPVVREKFGNVVGEIRKLPRDTDSFGLIHGDLHANNLFYTSSEFTLIDFDSCAYDWFIKDFVVALYHIFVYFETTDKESLLKNFLGYFWKGYLKENLLSDFWISRIPLFVEFQHMWTFAFAVSRIGLDSFSNEQKQLFHLMQHNIETGVPVVESGTWLGPPQ